MVKYFFDSYAIIELVKQNPNYFKYLDEDIILTKFNLAEVYYAILRDFGKEKAKEVHEHVKNNVVDFNDEILFHAMEFKLKNKKKNYSYADAIGYSYALQNKLIFLTGDKQFKDMKNVEYTPK